MKVIGDVLVPFRLDGLLEVNDGQLATVRGHQVCCASVAILVIQPHLRAVNDSKPTKVFVGQSKRHLVAFHGLPVSAKLHRITVDDALKRSVHICANVGRLLTLPVSLCLTHAVGPFLERCLVLCAVQHGGYGRHMCTTWQNINTSCGCVVSLEFFVHEVV